MKKVSVLFVLVLGVLWVSSASAEETYTVQRGDRLERVAAGFGVTPEELLAANPRTAYGVSCGEPRKVELRDGTIRYICGRPRFYLIAGKTLIIPASQLQIRTENDDLNAEVAALKAEMAELRQEREGEKLELAELAQERDRLLAANALQAKVNSEQRLANAKLQGEHDEAQHAAERILGSYQKSQAESSDNTFVLLLVVAFALLVCFIVSYYSSPSRKTKRLAEQVRRDQERLAAEQQAIIRDREEAARQRHEVEEKQRDLETRRAAIETDRKTVEEGRQANEKLKADLDTRDFGLGAAAGELDQRDQELRERNRALNSRETELFLAEEGLAAGERILRQDRASFQQDLEARRETVRKLAEREALVDAKLRTAAEDLPRIEADRGEVTRRVDAVRVREIDAARREKEAADREAAVKQREEDLRAQKEELQRQKSAAADHEVVFAQRVKEVTAREEQLHRSEGELRTKQIEFDDEMKAARDAFEQEKAEARGLLTRARRKEEIGRGLDKREAAIAGREQAVVAAEKAVADAKQALAEAKQDLEDQKANLQTWADRLADKERALAGSGDDVPTVVNGRGMAAPPPLPGPGESSTTDIDMRAQLLPRQVDSADIVAATHLAGHHEEASSAPAVAGPAHGTVAFSETGPRVPIADQPSHEESGFYCNVCHQAFSAEEYTLNHAAHNTGSPGTK